MSKKMKYDKQGRIILEKINPPGITYKYKYDLNKRIINIKLDSDTNLNRTIIHQEKVDNVFKTLIKKEFTDKIILTTVYDLRGRILKITRRKRGERKKHIKENLIFKEDDSIFWIETSGKNKNFGFKIRIK
jgi:YD repeat-containing protein